MDVPLATPDLSSEQTDVQSSASVDSGTQQAQGILQTVSNIGFSVASAVTGRPLVQNPQGGVTLGNAPVITGQVSVQMLVLVGAAIAIAVLVMRK